MFLEMRKSRWIAICCALLALFCDRAMAEVGASGTLKKINFEAGGCAVSSMTVKYVFSALMGEPTVNGSFQWEAGQGTDPKCLSNVEIYVHVSGAGSYGYIPLDGVSPEAGKGFGFNVTGSPDWSSAICALDGSTCLNEAQAKAIWKNMTVQDFEVRASGNQNRRNAEDSSSGDGFWNSDNNILDYYARKERDKRLFEEELKKSGLTLGGGDLQITLTWDTTSDIDLYVTEPGGETMYYQHKVSRLGGKLDVDDTNGQGPENVFWPTGKTPEGDFIIKVKYFGGSGEATNYKVRVLKAGEVLFFSGVLAQKGDQQEVATVSMQKLTGPRCQPGFLAKKAENIVPYQCSDCSVGEVVTGFNAQNQRTYNGQTDLDQVLGSLCSSKEGNKSSSGKAIKKKDKSTVIHPTNQDFWKLQ